MERFYNKIVIVGDCWIWDGAKRRKGYGSFKVDGKLVTASRFSYELHIGDINDGMSVLHKCNNPACVNPDHIFEGKKNSLKSGTKPTIESFSVEKLYNNVIIIDDCWIWMGSRSKKGYGVFNIKGKQKKAHRISYEFHKGEIPDGLFVCHRCDTPQCINPDHLFLGTNHDNMQDAMNKGRFIYNVHPSVSSYVKGCRCEECRKANNDYHGKRKKKLQLTLNQQ